MVKAFPADGYAGHTSGRLQPYWFDEVRPFHRSRVRSDLSVETAIVGAGMAGVMTAYRLAVQGRNVALFEDRAIGSGESGRTTAHFTHALDDRYFQIERSHGRDGARQAAESHTQAMAEVERIVREEGIRCDLQRVDGYLYLHPTDAIESLDKEYSSCRRAGLDVERLDNAPGLESGPCIRFPRQVQLHPLKLIAGLISRIEREGGQVFTDSRIEADGDRLVANGHRIEARHVLACTNVPFQTRLAMHAKQAAYRTYVVAGTLQKPLPKALWWDTGDQKAKAVAAPYHYVRTHDGPAGQTLIVGGEDHKTGHPERGNPFERLEAWARTQFGLDRVTHAWSGQVVEPFDHIAFIGGDPTGKARGLVTGDSGNGMTHAVIASLVLGAQVTGSPPGWAGLYDPGRKVKRDLPDFIRESTDFVTKYTDYVRPAGTRPERLRRGEGTVVHGLNPRAVYRHPDGRITECSAICPHLGCLVRWNRVESSFDCPCHGSRFTPEGQRVNGPANADLAQTEESAPRNWRHEAPPSSKAQPVNAPPAKARPAAPGPGRDGTP